MPLAPAKLAPSTRVPASVESPSGLDESTNSPHNIEEVAFLRSIARTRNTLHLQFRRVIAGQGTGRTHS